ncbi:MAG: MipA/OmpV family protein [Candidatus Zapsychrus exili]|nr:MipA/OmpV family protein [Candidatus Zapsychrus exili]
MKKSLIVVVLLCILFASFVYAEEQEQEQERPANYSGVGYLMTDSPYKGVGKESVPIPILYWHSEGGKSYVEGNKGGYQLIEYDNLKLDFIFVPRLMGYDDEDSTDLEGMQERKMSLDGGVGFSWDLVEHDGVSVDINFLTDLLGEHKGKEIELKILKKFKHDYFTFTPSAGVKWQSQDLVNYYYGVRSNEVAAGRSEYEPDASLNCFASINFNMGISQEWVIATYFNIERLSNEIYDSPIVDDNYVVSSMVGLVRKF